MTEPTPGDRVAVGCPACSPDRDTVHEVLSVGGQVTVRCTECDHVHKEQPPEDATVDRRVVVSQDGESLKTTVSVPDDEKLVRGEEFLAETPEALLTVRVTSLECADGRRDSAPVEDVQTIWTRAVGNVTVDVTIHPKDGRHDETESVELHVPGDYEFEVGETDAFGDTEFTVERALVRDDASGYGRDRFERPGDVVLAKDVKRLYVRDESTTAWSAW